MVTFELDKNAVLTDHEKQQLSEAAKRPIVYDEDSPPLTSEMEKPLSLPEGQNPIVGNPLPSMFPPLLSQKQKAWGRTT